MNRKLLTFNDFSFGFELEGLLNKKRTKSQLKKDLDSLLNLGSNGNMHNDGSLIGDANHSTFEYSSPVIPFTVENLEKFIKLMDKLPKLGVYTDRNCSLHIHFSHNNLTYTDAIWFMAYLANNEKYKNIIHSNIKNYCFYNNYYAEYKFLKEAYEKLNFGKSKNNGFFNILCDNEKYRCVRIHPQGTLEWRGPRTFLNINNHNKNVLFIKDLYNFIKLINESRNCDKIYSQSLNKYITRNDIKQYAEKKMNRNCFDFSSCNTDTYKSLKDKMMKNPCFINDITPEAFKEYKKELLDMISLNINDLKYFRKIVKKFSKLNIPFTNKKMFSNIIVKDSDMTCCLLKNMSVSFFKNYAYKIADVGGLTYVYEYLKKTGENPEILRYLINLAINEFGNKRIRRYTLNVLTDLINEDNENLFYIINNDWIDLIGDYNLANEFAYGLKLKRKFIIDNYKSISKSPNYYYFIDSFID